MRQGKGFLLVFALNDLPSFDAIDKFQQDIRAAAEREDIPIVVCGNKCDLPERQIKKEDVEAFCSECHLTYFETLSKNNINITESFMELTRQMRKQNPNRQEAPPQPQADPDVTIAGGGHC
jgi:GTPase SAR1 family protein